MQLERRDLRDGRQALDPIDLEIGLTIAGDRHEFEQVRRARHGVALKELLAGEAIGRPDDRAGTPLDMPHHPGPDRFKIAREIELGDRLRRRRRPATAALSGLEISTPMTTGLPADQPCAGRARDRRAGARHSVAAAVAGFSASTSAAGLSSRRPLNAACRTMPSPVQPANSISATSSGSIQWILASLRGAPAPVNGDFVAAAAFRRGRSARRPWPRHSRCRPGRHRRNGRRD